ncbi:MULTISPECIES: GNAT family N-acetyltransferase [unclassified Flavobacterium]|uniref:GNAT family N-acetyltransferase n=1 Tax=unclassified Flavobacterium TaxID=196869 RepID=UPI001F149552|nr:MULTISPECIES: GNAT family N-acetyltransferase [unclassified Flavobacterium]UMY66855.1 GNAT family N-acetyltransferase [Flavobacterium sp. HJ-32-4]
MDSISFTLYASAEALPSDWDDCTGGNIFLSRSYLSVLDQSGPDNMDCRFVGFFDGAKLCGVMLSQFLDLNRLESFGERDNCMKTTVRNFVFRKFASHVLFIGNNMLTGQNAFYFHPDIQPDRYLPAIGDAIQSLQTYYRSQKRRVHITSIKDFLPGQLTQLETFLPGYVRFSTQPNMVFHIPERWSSIDDYVGDLTKKYRDQFKRSHKRADGIEKRKMKCEEIERLETEIDQLYRHVAKNAPFNTFFLTKGHFADLKRRLGDRFHFYGYFLNDKLVGFNTLIRNGTAMDTYFLGYDEDIQREKMLYLNMLYDMVAYSIRKGFRTVVFARTALEIKSSVGAEPVEMLGLIRHSNPLIHRFLDRIFRLLEPKTEWQQRHPFKDGSS